MTTDIRKALGEKARIERDKAVAKEEAARKALLEVIHLRLPHNSTASLTVSAIPVVEAQALLVLSMTLETCLPCFCALLSKSCPLDKHQSGYAPSRWK